MGDKVAAAVACLVIGLAAFIMVLFVVFFIAPICIVIGAGAWALLTG